MARMGHYQIREINHKILKNLYGPLEVKLQKRKTEIARKNREYLFKELQPIIDQLPKNLFHFSFIYRLLINYKPSHPKARYPRDYTLSEVWQCEQPTISINPYYYGHMGSPAKNHYPSNLNPRLYVETAKLCEELIILYAEKEEMEKFLDTTTRQYSGTLQLRTIWPDCLHKYLPAEPIKQTKSKKRKFKAITPAIPKFIKHRMATNLIEDN